MFKSLFTNDSLRVVSKSKKTETRGRKACQKDKRFLIFKQRCFCILEYVKKQI